MDQTVSSKSLDHVMQNSSLAQPEAEDSVLSQFGAHAMASLKYNLVQVPVNALTEIVAHEANLDYENCLHKVDFFEPPKKDNVGTAAWLGDVCGNTAAAALPLILFHKLVGPGAATALETSADYGLRAAMPTLGKTALLGAAYGGILTPTSGDQDHFWRERGENAIVSAVLA
jgi:hypothetical protein